MSITDRFAAAVGITALAWAMGASAGELTIEAATGRLVASQNDGQVVWRLETPSEEIPMWTTQAGGLLLVDQSLLVDRTGRIAARWDAHHAMRSDPAPGDRLDCVGWDPLFQLTPAPDSGASDQHAPLLIDSAGNVWVINTHIDSGNYELQVRRSQEHSGGWEPFQTISDSTNYVAQPEGAIDADDNITIVFRDIQGGYKLYAISYEPGAGWGPLTLVHTSAVFFQAIEVAADAAGNVIAVFDPDAGSDSTVWSVVYNAQDGSWGAAVQVSAVGVDTQLPTLARSPSGDAVYLIYRVRSAGSEGIRAHRFDSQTLTWGPAELLPGSETVGPGFVGPVSRYPLTVGGDGEATVFWQAYDEPSDTFTVFANRTEAGVWQPAVEMLPASLDDTDIENFAYAESNQAGDVMGVITRYEGPAANRFYAFHYDHDAGWVGAVTPYASSLAWSTRVRASFHFDARATATLLGEYEQTSQLICLYHTGTDWITDQIDIPDVHWAFYQEVAADRGETMLVYEAEDGAWTNLGIFATWFRDSPPGDLDGDCDVDQADLGILLASYGIDAGGDCDGDGDTDQADLGILLANYGFGA